MQMLVQKTLAPVTINSAQQTESFLCPSAIYIAFSVVASSASSPVGTTIQIQGSLDNTNFHNLDTAVSVTGNGNFACYLTGVNAAFKYYRLSYARSSGSYIATTKVLMKGEEV